MVFQSAGCYCQSCQRLEMRIHFDRLKKAIDNALYEDNKEDNNE